MQNALRPVADHHRLIIKAKLGKRFFVAFQFETEGAVKRHVIDENLPTSFRAASAVSSDITPVPFVNKMLILCF